MTAPMANGLPDSIIAHRGGARYAPENTLTAFQTAAAQGVHWVETDVCLLGDGMPVLFHDADFLRLAGVADRVRRSDWKTVRQLDVGAGWGSGFRGTPVPRLEAALAEIARLGLGLNLELKVHAGEQAELVDAVVAALDRQRFNPGQLLISSFDRESLRRIRDRRPELALSCLCGAVPDDWRAVAQGLDLVGFNADYRCVSPATIATLVHAGLQTRVYTPNRADAVAMLWPAGLSGVITDDVHAFQPDTSQPAD